jgi:hypothetical protein
MQYAQVYVFAQVQGFPPFCHQLGSVPDVDPTMGVPVVEVQSEQVLPTVPVSEGVALPVHTARL